MQASVERELMLASAVRVGGTRLALECARNIHAAIDRHMPQAGALTSWLSQYAAALGLPETLSSDEGGRSRDRGISLEDWQGIGAALETAATRSEAADVAADRWIAAIRTALDLDPVATRILALALQYELDQRVDRLFDKMSECHGGYSRFTRNPVVIGLLLGLSTAEVATCLTGNAKLLTSGLLRLRRNGELDVLERLVSLIRQDIAPADDFYDQLLGTTDRDPLPWEAFAHLGREAEVAASLLQGALAGKERGVSILLYGPPGTGKTSFAATLAARVGARLRPVAETDADGDEPQRYERLAGLRLAQRLASPRDTVLLFDEAEDLFVSRSVTSDEPVTSSRVFIHQLLERLTVPVIWTANDIEVLGPAVLRRMTMCLQLRVPNLAARSRLWRRMGEAEGVGLQEADATDLARLVPAAPAVASAALRAARLAGGDAETVQLIVRGVARAVRGGKLPMPERAPDLVYDPALINADCDLEALTADLLRPGAPHAVSFLISGPPGAGKSAWVRHLAGRMHMPVLQKRASDLLDSLVGGTEQNIAEAFAQARETQSFLVFDEADSLLLERSNAAWNWEISQVNEMLTWMEGHAHPFACTTNLAERLDRASLRRFLVKLRFDWLRPSQARLAFRRFFGTTPPPGLDDLRTLTPADFALVQRRAAVRSNATAPKALLALLAAECDGRVGGRVPVGFRQPSTTS